jgi:hypothetical protein
LRLKRREDFITAYKADVSKKEGVKSRIHLKNLKIGYEFVGYGLGIHHKIRQEIK